MLWGYYENLLVQLKTVFQDRKYSARSLVKCI